MSKFDTVYEDVQTFFKDTLDGKLTVEAVTILTRYTMELVNSQNLKGSEKKALVLEVINEVVKDALEESDLSPEVQNAIKSVLSFAPMIIDATVDFAKIYSSGKKRCFCF